MTMREKIARAINRAGVEWLEQNDPKRMTLSWADVPDEVFADAVLSAMREPTQEMAEAGCRATLPYDEGDAARAYRAMITAALQEKGE